MTVFSHYGYEHLKGNLKSGHFIVKTASSTLFKRNRQQEAAYDQQWQK